MNQKDLEKLVQKYHTGELSEKEVINRITVFVTRNYPIYGLQKYDEDFRQDILLGLLEKGAHILHLYNPDYGDFFTFLYCYICTLINSRIKEFMLDSIKEKVNYEELVQQYEEKEIKYHKIDYKSLEIPKVPFAQKQLSPEDFQKAIKNISPTGDDRKVLILALKSSYYLTDHQIKKLCRMYKINPDDFYRMIQYCKNSLQKRYSRVDKAQQQRNYAYYHHKRYTHIIRRYSSEEDLDYVSSYMKAKYEEKERKHLRSMYRLNSVFSNGYYLRTTNKTISEVMGISEMQVSYYIKRLKNKYQKQTSDCDDENASGGDPGNSTDLNLDKGAEDLS